MLRKIECAKIVVSNAASHFVPLVEHVCKRPRDRQCQSENG